MAAVADTAEGNGESFLKQWLMENRLSKLEQKLLVEAEINAEELLDFALNTNEAIQFCQEYNVSSLLQKRFVKALQTFPARYAEQNNAGNNNNDNNNDVAPKIIVATLSMEEEEIINKVSKQRKDNKILNEKINDIEKTINDKQKLCYNQINNVFAELQKALNNEKNILQQQLQSICVEEKNKLLSSKKKIQESDEKIKKFQAKNNELLMNWKMDRNDRKQKVVQNGTAIINDNSFPIVLNENIVIQLKLNKDKAIKFISEMGSIAAGTSDPPQMTIKEISVDYIVVTATYDKQCGDIEALHAELCEDVGNGNFDDDVKLEWKENVFQIKDINESYQIENIQPNTKYGLRAKVKNQNGWSNYCNVNTFKSEKKPEIFETYNRNHWTVTNEGKTIKGNNNNCHPSPVYSTNGYNTGVHVWSIKSITGRGCCQNIGITSGDRNTPSVSGKYHYFYNFGGHCYHVEYPWKQQNDVVTVKLDCNTWKVAISGNDKKVLFDKNIAKHQTYYFAFNGCGNGGCHYELV